LPAISRWGFSTPLRHNHIAAQSMQQPSILSPLTKTSMHPDMQECKMATSTTQHTTRTVLFSDPRSWTNCSEHNILLRKRSSNKSRKVLFRPAEKARLLSGLNTLTSKVLRPTIVTKSIVFLSTMQHPKKNFNTREAIQQANDGFDRVGMDARGENALMHAIRNSPMKGLAYLVEVLCYHGADVNAKNSSGRTALDLARERTGSDYGEVQSTLLRYGAVRATSYSVGSAASYYAGHLSPSTSPTHQVVPRRSGTMRTLSMAFLSALLALENRR
jgi:hypothetical protein